MKMVESSSTHGEVSIREVVGHFGIPYTSVNGKHWGVPTDTICTNPASFWTATRRFCEAETITSVRISKDGRIWRFLVLGVVDRKSPFRNQRTCQFSQLQNKTIVQTSLHDMKVKVWCGFTTSTVFLRGNAQFSFSKC